MYTPLKNFENYYEINNDLQIRRIGKRKSGKIKSAYMDSNGYLAMKLSIDKKRKPYLLHRLIANHFIPNPFNKPEVNHKNGIKTDYSLSNLEWCTRYENMIHAEKLGLVKNSGYYIENNLVLAIKNKIKF